MSVEYQLHNSAVFYGKLSAVSSCSLGTDAFDTGDTDETTLKDAFVAIRGELGTGASYDMSIEVSLCPKKHVHLERHAS